MTERCICEDFGIQGETYELWIDSDRVWWLSDKVGQIDDHFLSHEDVERINQYIFDHLSDQG